MMKRPRSFIATLLILFCTAASIGMLAVPASDSHAGALTTRLMSPRAGDPQEPTNGFGQGGSLDGSYWQDDPLAVQSLAPSQTPVQQPSVFSAQAMWRSLELALLILLGGR